MKFEAGPLTSRTGLPHRSTQEQMFEGQRVPEGTVFIANIWFVVPYRAHKLLNFDDIRNLLGVSCTMKVFIQTLSNSILPDILVIKLQL